MAESGIEWVWIDAGGPLFPDSIRETGVYQRMATGLQKQGIAFDERRVESCLKNAVDCYAPSLMRAFVWQLTRPNTALYERVLRGLQDDLRVNQIKSVLPMRGEAREVLRQLSRRYRLAVYSAYGGNWLQAELQRFHALDLFSVIGIPARHLVGEVHEALGHHPAQALVFDGEDAAPYPLPDTRLFECAALATAGEPSACAVVGDRIDLDVIPAKSIGMRTVLLRIGDHGEQHVRYPEEAPDAIIQSLTQLPEAMEAVSRAAAS